MKQLLKSIADKDIGISIEGGELKIPWLRIALIAALFGLIANLDFMVTVFLPDIYQVRTLEQVAVDQKLANINSSLSRLVDATEKQGKFNERILIDVKGNQLEFHSLDKRLTKIEAYYDALLKGSK